MPDDDNLTYLVTGGNGFIGGHVARELVRRGQRVHVADITPLRYGQESNPSIVFKQGDLLDPVFCAQIVKDVDFVLHFAANMGGMGVIHEENDLIIYRDNHLMTLNIISAAKAAQVKKFLYASSACVYPASLQGDGQEDTALKEADVWDHGPPDPQGLYGLEKLHSELVLARGAGNMKIYCCRFHNVYGCHGSWSDGREKVPAALLRKILAGKNLNPLNIPVEIWGDGSQRRSFCFIDDAVDGVLRVLDSNYHDPVNIGSDRGVTIEQLARLAASAVGVVPSHLSFIHDLEKPVGVASRNSDNTVIQSVFGWSPSIGLEEGLRRTGDWMCKEMDTIMVNLTDTDRNALLRKWQKSDMVHLTDSGKTVFAIILPITSRTSPTSRTSECLASLSRFAKSLVQSTKVDMNHPIPSFQLRVYLAIDDDDEILRVTGTVNPAAAVLDAAGLSDVVTLECHLPPGHVCSLWRQCARRAWNDGCEYFVLMGDDVVLPDTAVGWMREVHDAFGRLFNERGVPHGFGCVAFTDTSFPGMPTFPVVHRTHLNIFDGQVVPDVFVNQDGDPFLFQLYRRFGCSTMISSEIRNTLGGSAPARYDKQRAKDWTWSALDEATCTAETYLHQRAVEARLITIDVVIPCYRVQMPFLRAFLSLKSSRTCSVMFIIIVDDPTSPDIACLEKEYGHRWDVRIRVNLTNSGASASRNRGLQESAAEWVLFLDDDTKAQDDILIELEKSIRSVPNAAGFVCNALFPVASSVFTTALHYAGVTYFWDIASKMIGDTDVPWGVTACLAARRNVKDGVNFDLTFPKTGGGEDIDFCRRKRQYSIDHGGEGFIAAPNVVVEHPYWNDGSRSYWRFYMWSKGDGALIKIYPRLAYGDSAPNSAELILLGIIAMVLLACAGIIVPSYVSPVGIAFGPMLCASVCIANVIHDTYRHLFRHPERIALVKTHLRGHQKFLAMIESTFIRMFSEWGRLVGVIERGEFGSIGRRFDWFAAHPAYGNGPRQEERLNSRERGYLVVLVLAVLVCVSSK